MDKVKVIRFLVQFTLSAIFFNQMQLAVRHYLAQPVVMQLSEDISKRLGQSLLNNCNFVK